MYSVSGIYSKVTQFYICMYSFSGSFPLQVIIRYCILFPVLYTVDCYCLPSFIYQFLSVNPQLPIYPSSFFPFGDHKFVCYVCESISVLCISSFIYFFKFPHISDVTCYLSFLKEVLTYIFVVFFLSYSPNITPNTPLIRQS